MQDPNPENIMGQKSVSHSVEWHINVGYTLLALLGLYVAYKLSRAVTANQSEADGAQGPVDQFEGISDGAEMIELE